LGFENLDWIWGLGFWILGDGFWVSSFELRVWS